MSQTDPPSSDYQNEQRMTFRLLAYWYYIQEGRPFPALADVNIRDITELWHHSFTIDVRDPGAHIFHYFGPSLISLFKRDYTSEPVDEAMGDLILNNTIGCYEACLAAREPKMESSAFTYNGQELRYRSLSVPLSNNGVDVDYVMGTTNYKLF